MDHENAHATGMKALLARWTLPVLVGVAITALTLGAAAWKVHAALGWMMEAGR